MDPGGNAGPDKAGPGRRGLRTFRLVLNAVAVVFVLGAVYDLWRRWDSSDVQVRLFGLALALITSSLAMVAQFLGWRALIRAWSGKRMPWVASARLYIDSQLARYTPGKVGLPAVRIAGAADVGVAPQILAATLGVELLCWCAVGVSFGAGLLGALFWGGAGRLPIRTGTVFPWAASFVFGAVVCLSGLVLLVFVDRQRFPRGVLSLLRIEGEGPLLPVLLPLYHGLHFGAWTATGVALTWALGQPLLEGLWAGAALVLSIVGGFLALLAPAGAGVREVIVAYCVAPLWGSTLALSFGVLSRSVSLLSDVLLWGVARLFSYRAAREN